jgi:ATPase subunit of ABC transporter with duplicated ATPase domains
LDEAVIRVLELKNVCAGFDRGPGSATHQDVSFSCRRGEITAIIGAIERGKSTLNAITAAVAETSYLSIIRGYRHHFTAARQLRQLKSSPA